MCSQWTSSNLKYFSCITDKFEGMKACGLPDVDSSPELQIEAANRSIEAKNIEFSKGEACYYMIKTNSSWTNSSRVFIYPSQLSGVSLKIANGSNRFSA
jgi:hypothetical protein